MVINVKHPIIHPLSRAIVKQFQTPFADGWVMQIGQGWETSNVEATASWLNARCLGDSPHALPASFEETARTHFPLVVKQQARELAVFLRSQSAMLNDAVRYPYPKLLLNMAHYELTPEQCYRMAHAQLEMLGNWRSVENIIECCEARLPRRGHGIRKLSAWIAEQQARYNLHPSELTLPLAHDLVRELYPDFHVHQ